MSIEKKITGKSVDLVGVTKVFGDVVAIEEIKFKVEAGEFCTLLGPSGSGKTTLLKAIAGFEKPTAGQVLIDDKDVTNVAVGKRKIGMVFQNYALFPHMTVYTNIAFPLQMKKLPKETIDRQVEETLKIVDLSGYGDRYPRQLSGGQQQRVAVARAIVFNPDILLMDEPLGALDKNLRQNLQIELKKIHRKLGATIIYVTHDQEEAMHMSDKIVVTNNGQIEQIGCAVELYNHPDNVFVAGFLGECNLIPATVQDSSKGKVQIQFESGQTVLMSQEKESFSAGESVILGIRPEYLYTGSQAQAAENKFKGAVEEVIFSGDSYKLFIQFMDQTLISSTPNRHDLDPGTVGQNLDFGFNSSESFLLSA